MKTWFYVGDSLEWLEFHKKVSGVTRVTVELFFAALDGRRENEFSDIVPCVLTQESREIASVSLPETISYLAAKTGRSNPAKTTIVPPALPRPNATQPYLSPQSGDCVLFTGVVWTPLYTELFPRLIARGIEFCVLVHDIIPIERPDLVSAESHRMFVEWLKIVVAQAKIVFVSSQIIKDQIFRWAALVGIDVTAQIVPVTFGSNILGLASSQHELDRNPSTARVNFNSFVLSVGTIDRRKNQALLCKVWRRLTSELGERRVPQLVFAGRDDLKLGETDADIASAIKSSQIVILEHLSDTELAGLYRTCLFTVFPSLSEGYGLPVAESLGHGKLCIASNLPTIKAHAGDLAWYFDPNVETTAFDLIRHTIAQPDLRLASERRIAQYYKRISWTSTFTSITEAIEDGRSSFSKKENLYTSTNSIISG